MVDETETASQKGGNGGRLVNERVAKFQEQVDRHFADDSVPLPMATSENERNYIDNLLKESANKAAYRNQQLISAAVVFVGISVVFVGISGFFIGANIGSYHGHVVPYIAPGYRSIDSLRRWAWSSLPRKIFGSAEEAKKEGNIIT